MAKTIDIEFITSPDVLACEIAKKYEHWDSARVSKKEAWKELQNYVFATDTQTTSNKTLPWKNSTTTPKLTQIRDNLHANYMASLFPNDDWLQWVSDVQQDDFKEKRKAIGAYMKFKLKQLKFESIISKMLYDWIDYGNCIGEVGYIADTGDTRAGEYTVKYIGPTLNRISPFDMVFDPTANSFEETPKITRSLRSLGELILEGQKNPEGIWKLEIIDKIKSQRVKVRNGIASKKFTKGLLDKQARFQYDGFGSVLDYYSGDLVEILEFEGSIYDMHNDIMYEDHKIIVVDRAWIVAIEPFSSWELKPYKKHSGWRHRTDNLWAMGPLDNLVGMQYRLDHVENLKSDILDLIVHPIIKIRGEVDFTGWGPGAEVLMQQDSDFQIESPAPTALQANFELDRLQRQMEELAGAPKEAMGIRTPGEKTKFEVSSLQNAASRLFQSKLRQFEEEFLEPVLNAMFEIAVRNFNESIKIKVENEDLGIEEFREIKKSDLSSEGRLRPIGARHFARQAQLIQDVSQLISIAGGNDKVSVHISGLKVAKLYEEHLQLEKYELVKENIAIAEQLDTQRMIQAAEEAANAEAQEPSEPTPGDIDEQLIDASLSDEEGELEQGAA